MQRKNSSRGFIEAVYQYNNQMNKNASQLTHLARLELYFQTKLTFGQ